VKMRRPFSVPVYKQRFSTTWRNMIIAGLVMILLASTGCGGGGGGVSGTTSSFSVQLSSGTVTVPAGGSIGRVNVTIGRNGSTGTVSLSVSGLPAGASATFVQPLHSNTGEVDLNPGTAVIGTYSLAVEATDGVKIASQNLSLVINSGTASLLPGPFSWSSTAPLISAVPDVTHPNIAVKDPTVVFYNNLWHVYATTGTGSSWSIEYINFPTWQQAASAVPYYMDANPGFTGYHAAPEVFFFRPQNKWYLIFQSPQPQYSTADDLSQPATWTAPQNFFASQPANVPNWIDFWVICDATNCYLFFSGDDGNFYRSQTSIQSFPSGFSTPVVIMHTANLFDLFEASNTYYLQGLNQYLTLNECIDSSGRRYFRAFVASQLGGDWTPIRTASTSQQPFAGINNVVFDSGVTPWTIDISHGEMLRAGYDETLTIDPNNLQYLYQGTSSRPSNYAQIPWQLGLLH
jgi:glycosyl hydrolase family 62